MFSLIVYGQFDLAKRGPWCLEHDHDWEHSYQGTS